MLKEANDEIKCVPTLNANEVLEAFLLFVTLASVAKRFMARTRFVHKCPCVSLVY